MVSSSGLHSSDNCQGKTPWVDSNLCRLSWLSVPECWVPWLPASSRSPQCALEIAFASLRKNLVSVKFFARNSRAGNGCANFMGAKKNCVLSAGKPPCPKIPRFRGGVLGSWRGGKCRFYFMGARIFLIHGPLDICLDLLPTTAAQAFATQGGAHHNWEVVEQK